MLIYRLLPRAACLALAFGLVLDIHGPTAAAQTSNPAALNGDNWTASWASAQMAPYGTEVLSDGAFQGATLREVVHLALEGGRLRIKISNLSGSQPLVLNSVHASELASDKTPGSINPAAERSLTFDGSAKVAVPMGAEYLSDPLDMPVAALSDLAITLDIESAPKVPTLHAGAHATSFLVPGHHASDVRLIDANTFTRWYFVSGVDVQPKTRKGQPNTVVAFGDSITDGHASTTDGNDRWPDVLAKRFAATATARKVSVVNEGIGGNRVLEDGIATSAMARFSRDALDVPGVRTVIVLEGINDIGCLDRVEAHAKSVHDGLVDQLETAFSQMAIRAHTQRIRIVAGTLTPFVGSDYYHPGMLAEADRQRLNSWIRTYRGFDGVIDFDAALRDPVHPDRMSAVYDSGDHLHPGPAGYARMAAAVPLELVSR